MNKEYRQKLFTDLYTNIIPERIPVQDCFGFEFQVLTAGKNLMEFECTFSADDMKDVMDHTLTYARGDMVGIGSPRDAIGLMLQKNNTNKMSSSGFIQHPETEMMSENEYDEFIKNPHEFMRYAIAKKQYGMFDDDPVLSAMAFARYLIESNENRTKIGMATKYINDKYGLYSAPAGCTGSQPIPFDNLADFNRGFTGITMDIKRRPQKVLDAIEALMPYSIWKANKSKADPRGYNSIATHMGPFLRTKEFEKFYWPSFQELLHIQAARGQQTAMFCENDWSRFIDYLQDLPMGTRMCFEFGNYKDIKDKLGKKMVLGGWFPVTLLKNGTKEQCVDKVKEIIDIMAPGGNYYFRLDKPTLHKGDVNMDNYNAVMDYVLNVKYDNAGEKVSDLVKADTIHAVPKDKYPEFKSKYIQSFDEYIGDYDGFDPAAYDWLKVGYDTYNSKATSFFE